MSVPLRKMHANPTHVNFQRYAALNCIALAAPYLFGAARRELPRNTLAWEDCAVDSIFRIF